MEEHRLPANFEWFKEQIAGHHPSVIKNGKREIGFLKEAGSPHILKLKQEGKRGECEVELYERLRNVSSSQGHPDREFRDLSALAKLVPRYYGLRQVPVGEQDHSFLELEDLTRTYSAPAILDVKMGRVTYDPLANEEKRRKETVKYPPQSTLGFRILGYRIHSASSSVVSAKDRKWGQSIDEATVQTAFDEFFQAAQNKETTGQVLSHLSTIHDWFTTQRTFHIYASSLLFIYETDPSKAPRAEVRMIDFSHTFPANDAPDSNYIHGLETVTRLVSNIHDRR